MDRGNVGNDRLRRCVIIAAPGSETSALARALGDRGVDCLLAQDIAPGGEISQEILKELAATDFVVASLHGETSPGLAFELGVAHALRKPMIAFTTNYDHLLDDLLGTYVVRKAPVASPEFADDIDRFLRHATPPPPVDRQPPSRPPADLAWARERAALLKVEGSADRGLALEQLVIELFEAAGDPIIHGKERPDRGVRPDCLGQRSRRLAHYRVQALQRRRPQHCRQPEAHGGKAGAYGPEQRCANGAFGAEQRSSEAA